jgi:type I restriction enzyme R subunit
LSDPGPAGIIEPPDPASDPRKYYVDAGHVAIVTHATQDLDGEGRKLHVTEFRDFTRETVRALFPDLAAFRHSWSNPDRRAETLAALAEKGIDANEVAVSLGQPEVDPFDVLCQLAWNAPVLTRAERAARLRVQRPDFFAAYGEAARQILDALLAKYAVHGPSEFSIPESLKVHEIEEKFGNVPEIVARFGDASHLRTAVTELQKHLYAA